MGADSIPSGGPRKEFLMIAMLCAAVWPLLMTTLSVLAWRKIRPVRDEAKLMAA